MPPGGGWQLTFHPAEVRDAAIRVAVRSLDDAQQARARSLREFAVIDYQSQRRFRPLQFSLRLLTCFNPLIGVEVFAYPRKL